MSKQDFSDFMTEKGAHTHICPYITNGSDSDDYYCRGSLCMAWRWANTPEYKNEAEAEYRRSGNHLSPTYGYCGNAGRPEI